MLSLWLSRVVAWRLSLQALTLGRINGYKTVYGCLILQRLQATRLITRTSRMRTSLALVVHTRDVNIFRIWLDAVSSQLGHAGTRHLPHHRPACRRKRLAATIGYRRLYGTKAATLAASISSSREKSFLDGPFSQVALRGHSRKPWEAVRSDFLVGDPNEQGLVYDA